MNGIRTEALKMNKNLNYEINYSIEYQCYSRYESEAKLSEVVDYINYLKCQYKDRIIDIKLDFHEFIEDNEIIKKPIIVIDLIRIGFNNIFQFIQSKKEIEK